ncbi:MAG: carbon monoxide dehydrogenase subunit G [Gammaproteobacteria bacterium]|nr:carbon monoxide dehydrogenase subunit G [Gammaproteobacteria bacterium]MCP5201963.1 carbon monoxide dehydrogenase subunit G [Gammaproteobacteria bacterium]
MELKDQIRIDAPRERVFAALNDAEVLRQAIPGCEAIEATADNEFTATVSAKVGPLKARFNGQVTLSDIVPPESYTLAGEGRGGPAGHAKVRSNVRLEPDGNATVLHYDVRADIGGKLAQLGGSLVQKTAEKLAAEFFRNFEELVAGEAKGGDQAATAAEIETTTAGAAVGGKLTWLWLAGGALALAVIAWLAL